MISGPRSTTPRMLAAMAYLLPVAVALLCMEDYRQIRLIRHHARLALWLNGTAVVGMALLSLLSALLGMLPGLGFPLLVLAGLGLTGILCMLVGGSVWGALQAFQGRTPGLFWDFPTHKEKIVAKEERR